MHPTLLWLGSHPLPSYVALMALAGIVSLLGLWRFRERMGLRDPAEFWLLANVLVLSGFVGGRLASLLLDPSASLRVSRIGAIWLTSDEGLPTFGVLAGILAGIFGYARWLGRNRRPILDYVFLVAPLGHGIARIGCFLAGCCCGRPAAGHLPWTVIFTDPRSEVPWFLLGRPLHPVQLYEAGGDFILAGLLYGIVRPRVEQGLWARGMIAVGYFAGYGLLRFITEFFRADATAFFGAGLAVEQALALGAILIAGGIGFVLSRRPHVCWAASR